MQLQLLVKAEYNFGEKWREVLHKITRKLRLIYGKTTQLHAQHNETKKRCKLRKMVTTRNESMKHKT